jgi:hypothetical protein
MEDGEHRAGDGMEQDEKVRHRKDERMLAWQAMTGIKSYSILANEKYGEALSKSIYYDRDKIRRLKMSREKRADEAQGLGGRSMQKKQLAKTQTLTKELLAEKLEIGLLHVKKALRCKLSMPVDQAVERLLTPIVESHKAFERARVQIVKLESSEFEPGLRQIMEMPPYAKGMRVKVLSGTFADRGGTIVRTLGCTGSFEVSMDPFEEVFDSKAMGRLNGCIGELFKVKAGIKRKLHSLKKKRLTKHGKKLMHQMHEQLAGYKLEEHEVPEHEGGYHSEEEEDDEAQPQEGATLEADYEEASTQAEDPGSDNEDHHRMEHHDSVHHPVHGEVHHGWKGTKDEFVEDRDWRRFGMLNKDRVGACAEMDEWLLDVMEGVNVSVLEDREPGSVAEEFEGESGMLVAMHFSLMGDPVGKWQFDVRFEEQDSLVIIEARDLQVEMAEEEETLFDWILSQAIGLRVEIQDGDYKLAKGEVTRTIVEHVPEADPPLFSINFVVMMDEQPEDVQADQIERMEDEDEHNHGQGGRGGHGRVHLVQPLSCASLSGLISEAHYAQQLLKDKVAPASSGGERHVWPPHDRESGESGNLWSCPPLLDWMDMATDPGVKPRERCTDKMEHVTSKSSTAGYRAITDAARLTLHFTSCRQLLESMEQIEELFVVHEIHNFHAHPTLFGFCHITLYVELDLDFAQGRKARPVEEGEQSSRFIAELRLQHSLYSDAMPEAEPFHHEFLDILQEVCQVGEHQLGELHTLLLHKMNEPTALVEDLSMSDDDSDEYDEEENQPSEQSGEHPDEHEMSETGSDEETSEVTTFKDDSPIKKVEILQDVDSDDDAASAPAALPTPASAPTPAPASAKAAAASTAAATKAVEQGGSKGKPKPSIPERGSKATPSKAALAPPPSSAPAPTPAEAPAPSPAPTPAPAPTPESISEAAKQKNEVSIGVSEPELPKSAMPARSSAPAKKAFKLPQLRSKKVEKITPS